MTISITETRFFQLVDPGRETEDQWLPVKISQHQTNFENGGVDLVVSWQPDLAALFLEIFGYVPVVRIEDKEDHVFSLIFRDDTDIVLLRLSGPRFANLLTT